MKPSRHVTSIATLPGGRRPRLHPWATITLIIATLGLMAELWGADPMMVSPKMRLVTEGAKDQDDACIWVHPNDGAQSAVIGSDKSSGKIIVYDLAGSVLQKLSVVKPGNVDIRQNVALDGFAGDLVVVNQRSGGFRLHVYRFDQATRTLSRVDGDRVLTRPNYGGCLYHSRATGQLYFLCTADAGKVEQHEIIGDGMGKVSGRLVRSWQLKKCEGAVADDITGMFYIAEEKGSIWKFPAEPDQPTEGKRISGVGEHGITGDLEGLAVYRNPNQPACLLVSDQGRNRFLRFSLSEPHTLLGEFLVEGAADTDGIDVTSANLGPAFPHGLFVCHTDRAPRPLLLVPWQNIDPR
jgi:3-phytase